MTDIQPLHRIFGLAWMDRCEGTNVEVETELDLSLKQQRLDMALICKGAEPMVVELPDGFDLTTYNLVTFKSYCEALDAWAIWELISYFVNYRKQASPSLDKLLPLSDFRLFAVCVRFPQGLAEQVTLTPVQEGAYDLTGFALTIRVIVINQLPRVKRNAMLHQFSTKEELIRYGREHFHPRSPETSSLLLKLLTMYCEDPNMSEQLKEFARQTLDELFAKMPIEKRLKLLTAEERVKGLSADELLQALPAETLEALRRQLKANGSSSNKE